MTSEGGNDGVEKANTATFVVKIENKQNATWQGSLTWAEKRKTICFRSALELLKMIDGALDEDHERA